MKKLLCLSGIICQYLFCVAQSDLQHRKGSLYLTWGYNRAYYNKSDVHFRGENFDFTLHDARAEDMPEKFRSDVYFNPTQFTVPQFNFRLGYYFSANTAISLGWDHMKYHLIPTQLVKISGFIDEGVYPLEEYTGRFDRTSILYSPSFMDYHHSDGFNFIRLAIDQRLPLWFSANGKHAFSFMGSASVGAVMPWTDFTFFGQHHRNKPHLAGYGLSIHAGMRFEFFRHFFIQITAQSGWTNLTDIMLEDDLPSRAEQKIVFFERAWALGAYIPIKKSAKALVEQ
jgi:hypothetical protein